MAKRNGKNNNQDLVSLLLDASWQLNVVLAVVVFVAMRWLIPATVHAPILALLVAMTSGFAIFPAVFFLLMAVASYIRNKKATNIHIRVVPPSFSSQNSTTIVPPNSSLNNNWVLPTENTNDTKSRSPEWSVELLKSLEWKRFEMLAAEYFLILGKRVETFSHGADGGIDARIYAHNSNILEYAIQCKAWRGMVGVKEIRELFGVMAHESARKGIFMATGIFSDDAKKFAADHSNKLFLIDGQKFVSMIGNLPEEKKTKLLAFALEGDFTTPTCATCGIKMVWRSKGNFWGCSNFPRCKSTLNVAHA